MFSPEENLGMLWKDLNEAKEIEEVNTLMIDAHDNLQDAEELVWGYESLIEEIKNKQNKMKSTHNGDYMNSGEKK